MNIEELCEHVRRDHYFVGMATGFAIFGSNLKRMGDMAGYKGSQDVHTVHLRALARHHLGREATIAELILLHTAVGEAMMEQARAHPELVTQTTSSKEN